MSKEKELEGVSWLLSAFDEDEIDYEDYEGICTLRNEIEKDSNSVIEALDNFIASCESHFFDRGICPVCGGAIVNERNSAYDTYVPYGSTYVCESEGYDSKCECCGYRGE